MKEESKHISKHISKVIFTKFVGIGLVDNARVAMLQTLDDGRVYLTKESGNRILKALREHGAATAIVEEAVASIGSPLRADYKLEDLQEIV